MPPKCFIFSYYLVSIKTALAFSAPRHQHQRRMLSSISSIPLGNRVAQAFIDETNEDYERLHFEFETQFWGTKMALKSPDYSLEKLKETKQQMESFLSSADRLRTTRNMLEAALTSKNSPRTSVTPEQLKTLRAFERTFGCYSMESAVACSLRSEATTIENELGAARNKMTLGAKLKSPSGGEKLRERER
jgi:hypothetical protein